VASSRLVIPIQRTIEHGKSTAASAKENGGDIKKRKPGQYRRKGICPKHHHSQGFLSVEKSTALTSHALRGVPGNRWGGRKERTANFSSQWERGKPFPRACLFAETARPNRRTKRGGVPARLEALTGHSQGGPGGGRRGTGEAEPPAIAWKNPHTTTKKHQDNKREKKNGRMSKKIQQAGGGLARPSGPPERRKTRNRLRARAGGRKTPIEEWVRMACKRKVWQK